MFSMGYWYLLVISPDIFPISQWILKFCWFSTWIAGGKNFRAAATAVGEASGLPWPRLNPVLPNPGIMVMLGKSSPFVAATIQVSEI